MTTAQDAADAPLPDPLLDSLWQWAGVAALGTFTSTLGALMLPWLPTRPFAVLTVVLLIVTNTAYDKARREVSG